MKKNRAKQRLVISFIVCGIIVLFFILISDHAKAAKSGGPKMSVNEMEVAVEFEKSEDSTDKKELETQEIKPISSKGSASQRKSGGFPPIRADYRKYIGFKKYTEYMNQLGGVFILYNTDRPSYRKLDFRKNRLSEITLNELQKGKFSKRTRVIRDEPYLRNFLKGKAESGSEVILLIPRRIETHIVQELERYFVQHNLLLEDVFSFEGYYHLSGGNIILTLRKAVEKNKKRIVNLSIKL